MTAMTQGKAVYSDPTGPKSPTTNVNRGNFKPTRPGTFTSPSTAPSTAPSQDSSYTAIIKDTLTQWGLASLIPVVTALGKDSSNTSDMIYLKLQQTKEWKERFAGNEARLKAGLGVLSPAEYIALESQYKQTLRQYGLPQGFYDNKAATDGWIGGDVSPAELASRAKEVADLVYNSPPEALQNWNKYYGGGAGGAIAAILDKDAALPLIQREVAAAQIGGAAAQQGLGVDRSRAEQFAQAGVTLDSARQAYQQIAARLQTDSNLSNRFGTQFGQAQEENAMLLNDAGAVKQQQMLYNSEQAQFGGHGGANDASNADGTDY